MDKIKEKNTRKIIIIILLILIGIGLFVGISSMITKTNGNKVEVKVTSLKDYGDNEHGSKYVVYGEIITDGEYKGKKVRFATTIKNEYKVGDIVKGNYTDDFFQRDKK